MSLIKFARLLKFKVWFQSRYHDMLFEFVGRVNSTPLLKCVVTFDMVATTISWLLNHSRFESIYMLFAVRGLKYGLSSMTLGLRLA